MTATTPARPAAAKLAERLGGEGISLLPGALPAGHGRQRLRAEGDAGDAVARRAAALGRAHGRTGCDPRRRALDPADPMPPSVITEEEGRFFL